MSRPDDAKRLLTEYRRKIAPSTDQLAQVRARLDASKRPSQRRAAFAVGVASALAAAVLLAWWGLNTETATPQTLAPAVQAQHEAANESAAEPWTEETPPPPPTRARVEPLPAADSSPTPALLRPPPRVTPPETSPHPSALRLAAEAKLIRTAEAQLRKRAYSDALKTLEAHARTFPAGALGVERRALRSIALCRTGNLVQGRGEGSALRRDPASAPYRDRIAQACK